MTDISILDQSPLDDGQTVRAAIERSVKLAQLADNLKYKRYFVAEHHNMPEVLWYESRNTCDTHFESNNNNSCWLRWCHVTTLQPI